MKRKLVKQGAATLMVSLPAKWAKENGLDKGDEVNVEEDGKRLVIKLSEETKKEQKAKINVSNYTPLVNRVLMALYIKGIDELEVTFSRPEEIKDFQKRVINELIGFEILQQSNTSMTIKDISGSDSQEIETIIQRIFFIIDSMIEEFSEALEKKQSLDPIIEIDSSINKFVNFCLRMLNKKGYPELHKTPQIYGIVTLLEEIGDVYKKLAQESQKTRISKEQVEILNDTRISLRLFKELLFHYEKQKAVDFSEQYLKIKEKIKNKNKIDFLLGQLNDTIIWLNSYLLVISV